MSVDDNTALMHRIAEAFNARNIDTLDDIFAADYTEHSVENFKQFFARAFAAFPDSQLTVEDVIADEDKVGGRSILRGTHRGTFFSEPPTNKQVTFAAIDLFRVANGKVVEHWDVVDRRGLMRQLGVQENPGANDTTR